MTDVGFIGLGIMGRPMARNPLAAGHKLYLHSRSRVPRALALSLPNTATCQQLMNACAARGGGAWDHSALVRATEELARHEIGGSQPGD